MSNNSFLLPWYHRTWEGERTSALEEFSQGTSLLPQVSFGKGKAHPAPQEKTEIYLAGLLFSS